LVRLLLCLVQALPLSACQAAMRVVATLCYHVLRIRRRITDENLRHAFPELTDAQRRQLAWRMWQHLLLFIAETGYLQRKLRGGNYWQYIRFNGEEELTRALLSDRPLILVTGHFGHFELASYAIALFGHRLFSVARPLDNPYLDEYVSRRRSSCGQTMLAKQGDYERIIDLLSAGATITFVADQYAGSKGCWVEFFHRPASAHKAIALFALQHDAPIVVGYCRRMARPMQFELTIQGTLDPRSTDRSVNGVKEITQWYTTQIEKMVRQAPEQYWWLHRRWKDNRERHRKAKQAARAA
jgi:KDO2-lipid IV(A) lauroyltransferase